MANNKQCARCGNDFSCGRDDEACWCSTLPALPRRAISENSDCLCVACLRAALDEYTPVPTGIGSDEPS